jgi:hypothetical protein
VFSKVTFPESGMPARCSQCAACDAEREQQTEAAE